MDIFLFTGKLPYEYSELLSMTAVWQKRLIARCNISINSFLKDGGDNQKLPFLTKILLNLFLYF